MVTRIASTAINSTLSSIISNNYSKFAKTTAELGTGHKINSILDDSAAAINILSSNIQLNQIGVYKDNVTSITNEVKNTSDTLSSVITKSQRAYDLATTAATGTSTSSTLNATLKEVDQLISGMASLGNTTYKGSYIFSGANTSTPAYSVQYGVDSSGNTTDEIVGIKYNGTELTGNWQRKLEVSDGMYQTYNVSGDSVMGDATADTYAYAGGATYNIVNNPDATEQANIATATGSAYDSSKTYYKGTDGTYLAGAVGTSGQVNIYNAGAATAVNATDFTNNSTSSGIMGTLIKFRNALSTTIKALDTQSNLPTTATSTDISNAATAVSNGYKSINGLLNEFQSSIATVTNQNTAFGTITNKMEMTTDSLTNSEDNLTEYVSGLQDADVSTLSTQWYSEQSALQASMKAATSIMSMSLLDYM